MATLIRGGTVVDPVNGEQRADIRIARGRIVEVGADLGRDGADEIDAGDLVVLPGSIDAHSHADSLVLCDDIQESLLRQGVTTVIVGQDGVSYSPGDGAFGSEYFGPLIGALTPSGPTIADLLSDYRQATRLGVGYLIPAGTVRHEVMGDEDRPASTDELVAMQSLVEEGMAQGALGLSTGFDYVPNSFADASETAALCEPVARAGGMYVSHMRGYEEQSAVGFAELCEIARRSGVRAHVSHFHARVELMRELLAEARDQGVDVSFDSYPYLRGFSILSMMVLDKGLESLARSERAAALRHPEERVRVRQQREDAWRTESLTEHAWAQRVQIAAAGSTEWAWSEGLTLDAVAAESGLAPLDAAIELLLAGNFNTTAVLEYAQRGDDALAEQYALPGATVGSDGIFLGSAPHPRAFGTFARMYRCFVIDRGDFTWSQMAAIIAGRPAERYGLHDRGRLVTGARADVVLVDPGRFIDRAWYNAPRSLAEGVERVFVAGDEVLGPRGLSENRPGGPALRPTPV